MPSRFAHVGLLLLAMMAAAVTGSLLLTEPALPRRTQTSFGAILGIAVAWVAYATWALARRRVLFARHRVVAAGIGLAASAAFSAGALAAGWRSGSAPALLAAGLGLVMLGCAAVLLVRARRTFARLSQRRAALERELGITE